MTNLTLPIFTDTEKARVHLEGLLWPSGPVCPHCGVLGENTLVKGKSHRPGMYMCNACRQPFSVTVGTIMEKSHIPLNKWVLGFHLMASSKKGISAHQLHRQLGITYKAAWFMAHRIREAMTPVAGSEPPLGGEGQVVEADETELARSRKTRVKGRRDRMQNKRFVSLVERGGNVRSKVIDGGHGMREVRKAVRENVDPASTLHTDGAKGYGYLMPIGHHEAVDHDKAFARKGKRHTVHCNTAEGYFSLFKRGLVGTYHHIEEQHLPRYLAEFDFRMNNRVALGVDDKERANRAIKGAEGKRLTYHTVSG